MELTETATTDALIRLESDGGIMVKSGESKPQPKPPANPAAIVGLAGFALPTLVSFDVQNITKDAL